jgi:hypothetical protein
MKKWTLAVGIAALAALDHVTLAIRNYHDSGSAEMTLSTWYCRSWSVVSGTPPCYPRAQGFSSHRAGAIWPRSTQRCRRGCAMLRGLDGYQRAEGS